jgi:hypothetical protein
VAARVIRDNPTAALRAVRRRVSVVTWLPVFAVVYACAGDGFTTGSDASGSDGSSDASSSSASSGAGETGSDAAAMGAGGITGGGGEDGATGSAEGATGMTGATTAGGSTGTSATSSGAGGTGGCAAPGAAVDFIVVVDNSGSMQDEMPGIEHGINVHFAAALTSHAVDYRVILISRHRMDDVTASEEASTSICVAAPLSGLAACPAEMPLLSDRFYQYSVKIESADAFDLLLSTYADAALDRWDNSTLGWSEWLRPGVSKMFLLVSDGNEDMLVDTFLQQLTALGPSHFGADATNPTFVFHSVTGLPANVPETTPHPPSAPIASDLCNIKVVDSAGEVHQELAIRTGGLRFSVCNADVPELYDAVVAAAAGPRACD